LKAIEKGANDMTDSILRTYDDAIAAGFKRTTTKKFNSVMATQAQDLPADSSFQCTMQTDGHVCMQTCIDGFEYVSICRNGVCKQHLRRRCI